jgi:hypothetical protein
MSWRRVNDGVEEGKRQEVEVVGGGGEHGGSDTDKHGGGGGFGVEGEEGEGD